jgi:hypothetical protein
MRNQNFGVEIELAGVSRSAIAEAVSRALQGNITMTNSRDGYNSTIITDQQGRAWKVMNDSSIPRRNGYEGSEIVTPILNNEDIELLQKVVRSVKATGAKTPPQCGIHIHIDGEPHTPKSIAILAKMVYKNEELIFDALKTHGARLGYTRSMKTEFIEKVSKTRTHTKDNLNESWFGNFHSRVSHYNGERYHGLNLNNIWRDLGTIEFRYFNSTLHAGKVKAYIQFCLALSERALTAKSASHKKIVTDNPKYNFRVWLVSTLNLKGDEFKTARYHLTRYLQGNSAWKTGH